MLKWIRPHCRPSTSNQDFDLWPRNFMSYVLVYCCLFMVVLVLPDKPSLSSPSLAFFSGAALEGKTSFQRLPGNSQTLMQGLWLHSGGLRVQCSASVVEHGWVGRGEEHVSVWRVRDDEVCKEKESMGHRLVRARSRLVFVLLLFLFFSRRVAKRTEQYFAVREIFHNQYSDCYLL